MTPLQRAQARPRIMCRTCDREDLDWQDGLPFCAGCVEAGWSEAYARGFNAAIKTYWQNICLQKAMEADGRAADLQLGAWGSRSRAGVTDRDGVLRMHESYFNAGPPGSPTRRHWMVSGLRLLDDLEDAYQKARDAAEVGRQLRKWASE